MNIESQAYALISYVRKERPNITTELEYTSEVRLCMDDFTDWEYGKENLVTNYLNQNDSTYHFKHVSVFGGFGSDLVISNRELKRQEDEYRELELKTKPTHTYMELWQKFNKDYGVQTSSTFHTDPSGVLTESEFQEQLAFYKAMAEIIHDDKKLI